MFLKPPSGSDRPKPNRSNNGAFTNRPLPKLKAFKPPEAEESTVQTQNTAFVTWTKARMHGCSPIYQNVLDYVSSGSPFRGNGAFGKKDEVKEAGAKWLPNPSYEEGEPRKTQRGWWSAWDDKTLFTLLSLGSYINTWNRKCMVWSCHGDAGVLVEAECSVLKGWMDEFYLEVHGEEETKRVVDRSKSIVNIVQANREMDAITERNKSLDRSRSPPATPVVKYKQWPGHTTCSVCELVVTDQFGDCRCEQARWQRCAECWFMWRVDPGAATNTACGCGMNGGRGPVDWAR
jgi:hypothetical protein